MSRTHKKYATASILDLRIQVNVIVKHGVRVGKIHNSETFHFL